MEALSKLTEKRWPWGFLALTAFLLLLVAMYFQYVMDLRPCIMCIYQRTAVFGVFLSGLLVFLINNFWTRMLGFIGWGVSSVWGLLIAIDHVEKQTDPMAFLYPCEIVPNFPAFMPLHQWLPEFFGATGDCGSIDWIFLTLSMPQWMIVIFAGYSGVFALIFLNRLLKRHAI